MDARHLLAAAVTASISLPAFAQTQPTRPSAYPTVRTMVSAFASSALTPCYGRRHHGFGFFDRISPCYSGTIYPSYSAVMPFELAHKPSPQAAFHGASHLNVSQAETRIEAKGYASVSGLHKDKHGIWRGDATLKDGKPVEIVLDLEGNIYSEVAPRVDIWFRPLDQ